MVKASPCESWWWAAAAANMRSVGRFPPRPCAQSSTARPGNAGIAEVAECIDVAAEDIPGQVALAQRLKIDFVVIGPDAPLVAGMADASPRPASRCSARRRRPSSKAPRASPRTSAGNTASRPPPTSASPTLANAEAYIKAQGAPIVVKADGLAAGKGVIVAETVEQAIEAARDMLAGNRFGAAGASVVIEEFMDGEEASLFALSDGEHALPLVGAQDHKRAFDGDKGPNTGGMGAYSPAPILDAAMQRPHDARDRPADRRGDGRGRHAVQGRALCRPDDRHERARSWSSTTAASAIRNARC